MKVRPSFPAVLLMTLAMNSASADEPATLAPCPASPNCVSSQADDTQHYIEPLLIRGDPEGDWKRLQSVVNTLPRTTIVDQAPAYLHVEVRSLVFRFVDDVEFLLVPSEQLIHVRSASRTGYSDFGVNRRRVERIRGLMSEKRRD
jgi:uncharacterized protein (DUF1499 family)